MAYLLLCCCENLIPKNQTKFQMKNIFSFLLAFFILSNLSAQITVKTFGDSNSDENFMNEDRWSEIIRKTTNYNILSYAAAGATLSGVQRQLAYAVSLNAGAQDMAVVLVGRNDALVFPIEETRTRPEQRVAMRSAP